MKAYVAGPMRGLPQFNFPAFDSLTRWLRDLGHTVSNPAEHDREVLGVDVLEGAPGFETGDLAEWTNATGFSFHAAMQWDLQQVLDGDAIVLLPGWENSKGARYERTVAEAAGKRIWLAHSYTTMNDFMGDKVERTAGPWYIVTDPIQRRLEVTAEGLDPGGAAAGEMRIVDPKTGGVKGAKLARFDLLPFDALWQVAEQFGRGAAKYEDRNWEKGYAWGLSFAAMHRHLAQFWGGEDTDEETSGLHLAAVAWHALALLAFQLRGAGTDTRPGTVG